MVAVLSTYLAVRGAMLAHQIDNECDGEYDRAKQLFRQSFTTRVVERTVLTHPHVLPSIDLDDWDAGLDAMAEAARRACTAVAIVVTLAALWPLGAWAILAGGFSWYAGKRVAAGICARRINDTCRRSGWDVPSLLADLPEVSTRLKLEAAHGLRAGSHRASDGRRLALSQEDDYPQTAREPASPVRTTWTSTATAVSTNMADKILSAAGSLLSRSPLPLAKADGPPRAHAHKRVKTRKPITIKDSSSPRSSCVATS